MLFHRWLLEPPNQATSSRSSVRLKQIAFWCGSLFRTLRKLSGVLGVPLGVFITGLENGERDGVTRDELLKRLAWLLAERYTEPEAQPICGFVAALR